MLEEFIKLKSIESNIFIYLRPQDIVAMSRNTFEQSTKITTLHGNETYSDTVMETPGVICDMCDKVIRKHREKLDAVFKQMMEPCEE